MRNVGGPFIVQTVSTREEAVPDYFGQQWDSLLFRCHAVLLRIVADRSLPVVKPEKLPIPLYSSYDVIDDARKLKSVGGSRANGARPGRQNLISVIT